MENQKEVGQTEPSKDHVDGLIEELNEEHDVPDGRVTTPEYLPEVGNSIDGSEETAVQPTSSLQDEVGHFSRDIGLTGCGFDVLQDPGTVPFRDKFKTEDTIFGEVHVGSEDVGILAVESLSLEVLAEWPVPSLIIL